MLTVALKPPLSHTSNSLLGRLVKIGLMQAAFIPEVVPLSSLGLQRLNCGIYWG
jgi:hypothetical protein